MIFSLFTVAFYSGRVSDSCTTIWQQEIMHACLNEINIQYYVLFIFAAKAFLFP